MLENPNAAAWPRSSTSRSRIAGVPIPGVTPTRMVRTRRLRHARYGGLGHRRPSGANHGTTVLTGVGTASGRSARHLSQASDRRTARRAGAAGCRGVATAGCGATLRSRSEGCGCHPPVGDADAGREAPPLHRQAPPHPGAPRTREECLCSTGDAGWRPAALSGGDPCPYDRPVGHAGTLARVASESLHRARCSAGGAGVRGMVIRDRVAGSARPVPSWPGGVVDRRRGVAGRPHARRTAIGVRPLVRNCRIGRASCPHGR